MGSRRPGRPHWGILVIASTKPTFVSSLKETIARHPAGAFLVFFYVAGWIFFLPALLGTSGFGLLPYDLPPQPSILLLTLVGLAGGAFLVTRIADGKDGVRELRSRYFTWRTGPQWYLLALFGAPLLLLVGGAVVQGTSILGAFGASIPQFLPNYLLQVVLIAVLVSLWEETGWMAFLTARWQERFGPVLASLMVAPLFGLGHFPLLLLERRPDRFRPAHGIRVPRIHLLPPGALRRSGAADPHVGFQLDWRLATARRASARVLRRGRLERDPDGLLSRRGRTSHVLRSRDRRDRRPRDHARQARVPRTVGSNRAIGDRETRSSALALTPRVPLRGIAVQVGMQKSRAGHGDMVGERVGA